MSTFQVISYYTNDWDYPIYAEKLQDDCERLGLSYTIVEKPSTNSYVQNCQIKAFFIREMLDKIKRPVLWMDVDGSICRSPSLLMGDEILAYDMAGNHPIRNPERVHVGSIWLNYTDATRNFVDTWCRGIEAKKGIDDAAFNGTWDLLQNQVKFFPLPPEYFVILKDRDQKPSWETVIAHRLSNSMLKQEYKKLVG